LIHKTVIWQNKQCGHYFVDSHCLNCQVLILFGKMGKTILLVIIVKREIVLQKTRCLGRDLKTNIKQFNFGHCHRLKRLLTLLLAK
jgi:hypothetical protein